MKNKKKALARTVVVLCLCVLCMTIAAMLTTDHDARNVITTGNIDIGLNVKQYGYTAGYWIDNEAAAADYAPDQYGVPEELKSGALYVMPGTKQTRTIQVKNIDEDAYIRVKLDVSFDQGLSNSVVTCETVTDGPAMTGANWVQKDGWYYYKPAVTGGSVTELLTADICFDPNMSDDYQGAEATLTIYAEAVQVANMNVSDATEIADNIWRNEKEPGGGA